MQCIICEGSTKVINSRTSNKPGNGFSGLWRAVNAVNDKNIVWRQRSCLDCGERFDTVETLLTSYINIVKKDPIIRRRHEF